MCRTDYPVAVQYRVNTEITCPADTTAALGEGRCREVHQTGTGCPARDQTREVGVAIAGMGDTARGIEGTEAAVRAAGDTDTGIAARATEGTGAAVSAGTMATVMDTTTALESGGDSVATATTIATTTTTMIWWGV